MNTARHSVLKQWFNINFFNVPALYICKKTGLRQQIELNDSKQRFRVIESVDGYKFFSNTLPVNLTCIVLSEQADVTNRSDADAAVQEVLISMENQKKKVVCRSQCSDPDILYLYADCPVKNALKQPNISDSGANRYL